MTLIEAFCLLKLFFGFLMLIIFCFFTLDTNLQLLLITPVTYGVKQINFNCKLILKTTVFCFDPSVVSVNF